jgi:hypothetical protein
MQPVGLTRDASPLPAVAPTTEPPAAGPSNRFRAAQPPEGSLAREGDSGWSEWIGSEPLEQVKSALAVVGAMALLLHGLRWLRRG